MKQKSVLLLGSYGQSNLGDDVLMWNYLELLKQRGFTTIYVNANTTELIPEPVKAVHDLRIIDTYSTSLLAYVRLIKSVDCVVYGGGTLYKELYASTGRSKYSVIIRMMGFNMLARFFGTPLYHLNIGIGALRTWRGRWITRMALAAASHTLFRDQKSYDFARKTLRIRRRKITKSVDGLFLNHVWEKPWHDAELPAAANKKYRRTVGVNVLSDIPDWVNRQQYEQTMQSLVRQLLAAGDRVILVPFQHDFNPNNDKTYMEELFAKELKNKACSLLPEVAIDTVSSVLRGCDVFVGMRFHSLLLCVTNRVPFVAVAYDTKCWRFIQETNYPHAVELEKLDTESLLKLYEQAADSIAKTKKQQAEIAADLYKEAEKTAWKM